MRPLRQASISAKNAPESAVAMQHRGEQAQASEAANGGHQLDVARTHAACDEEEEDDAAAEQASEKRKAESVPAAQSLQEKRDED